MLGDYQQLHSTYSSQSVLQVRNSISDRVNANFTALEEITTVFLQIRLFICFFSVSSFLTICHVLVFGRWITLSSWRTSLLCVWDGKGRVVALFRRPIRCRYYCVSDSLLALLLWVSPTKTDKWPTRQPVCPLESESLALAYYLKFLTYAFFTCLRNLRFVPAVFCPFTFYKGA
jgi:hypothetical protein